MKYGVSLLFASVVMGWVVLEGIARQYVRC